MLFYNCTVGWGYITLCIRTVEEPANWIEADFVCIKIQITNTWNSEIIHGSLLSSMPNHHTSSIFFNMLNIKFIMLFNMLNTNLTMLKLVSFYHTSKFSIYSIFLTWHLHRFRYCHRSYGPLSKHHSSSKCCSSSLTTS